MATTCCFDDIFIPSGICTLPRCAPRVPIVARHLGRVPWSAQTAASSTYSRRQTKSTERVAARRLGDDKRRNRVNVVQRKRMEAAGELKRVIRRDSADVRVVRELQRLRLARMADFHIRDRRAFVAVSQ